VFWIEEKCLRRAARGKQDSATLTCAGADEANLYVNVGLKNHQQTKDEMERFMIEVAPHFQGRHLKLIAAE
jgi:hypothetical protein